MRGDLVNLNIKAFNKQQCNLISRSFEIPHYAYTRPLLVVIKERQQKHMELSEKFKNIY
jgi:hypothetical protein